MRQVIANQFSDGRSPQQVRDWFVARYGVDVLRAPHSAATVVLWALPAAVGIGVAIAAVWTLRRRRRADPVQRDRSMNRQAVFLATSGVVVAMVAAVAMTGWRIDSSHTTSLEAKSAVPRSDSVDSQLAQAQSLEQRGYFAAAADAYRNVVAIRPDPATRLQLAFALLRANHPDQAVQVAEAVHASQPADPDAPLILGLCQRALAKPEADQTLSRFLELAPNHPAAGDVRTLIGH